MLREVKVQRGAEKEVEIDGMMMAIGNVSNEMTEMRNHGQNRLVLLTKVISSRFDELKL